MLEFFLLLSLVCNGILIWYIRKLVQKLSYGVDSVDQLQELLYEYSEGLEGVYELQEYYGDDTIKAAIANTKIVIEACKAYKSTIIEKEGQEQIE
jgi:hypothetical protein